MAEKHNIAGPPRGEPLPAGRVGARIRIPLTGMPTSRWSRSVTARLSSALMGHPNIGHLGLSELVQGSELVLDGVEADEAQRLGQAISEAVFAANRDVPVGDTTVPPALNMSQDQADAIAHQISVDYDPPVTGRKASVKFPGR